MYVYAEIFSKMAYIALRVGDFNFWTRWDITYKFFVWINNTRVHIDIVSEYQKLFISPFWCESDTDITFFFSLNKNCILNLFFSLWFQGWYNFNYFEIESFEMEAIAKHDFNATADDELSFRKNQILKVEFSDMF